MTVFPLLRRAALGFALATAALTAAAPAQADMSLACDKAPKDAVTALPAPFSDVADVFCSPEGRMFIGGRILSPTELIGWVDPHQTKGLAPVFLQADPTHQSVDLAQYFVDFEAAKLTGLGKQMALKRFEKVADWDGGETYDVFRLNTLTNTGLVRPLFLLLSDARQAGYFCTEEKCDAIIPFYIVKLSNE